MRKLHIVVSMILLAAVLSACGSQDNSVSSSSGFDDLETTQQAGLGDNSETESGDDMGTESDYEVTTETKDDEADYDAMSYNQYFKFMLEQSDGQPAVFSPESLNFAMYLYSNLLAESDKDELQDWLGNREYFDYIGNDTFKIINRIWFDTNKDLDFSSTGLGGDILYGIDMSDSIKSTEEKNQFVADNTDNFITSTPTVFSPDTVLDAMNIIYFKDTWKDGDKRLDTETTAFHNKDGSTTDTLMFNDKGDYVRYTDNAHQYTMEYSDGFDFIVILPDEGHDISEIDLDAFIGDDTDVLNADVYFSMPEFESEVAYTMAFADFGLNDYMIDENIGEGISTALSQVAKIKVDHTGTEAAAVSEVMLLNATAMPEEKEIYEMVCDRPFVYYIRDTLNGDIAFIGCVTSIAE